MRPVKVYSTDHRVGGKHKRRRINNTSESNAKRRMSTWEQICYDVRNSAANQSITA